jgi:predicted acyltransferase (DUF342 family)
MREERGQVAGDIVIREPFTLWGSVAGTVRVINGGKFYHRGAIYGNLIVEAGGRCHVFGHIQRNLVLFEDTKVIHSGFVGGDAINNGGRLFVDAGAKVNGKIKTRHDGKTRIESKTAREIEADEAEREHKTYKLD